MNNIGVIQARMGSTRLPGKVMRPLAGRPLIWHIVDRLRRVGGVSDIVVATTCAAENDELAHWSKNMGLICVRHPVEDDIAGRLAMVIKATDADVLVKVNADCPLFDPRIAELALDLYRRTANVDGVTNKLRPTYPLGLSIELLGRHAVEWCDSNLTKPCDREFVVKWIFDHRKNFQILSLEADKDESHFNLTVDTPDDYAFIGAMFEALYVENEYFGWPEIGVYLSNLTSIPSCAYLKTEKV